MMSDEQTVDHVAKSKLSDFRDMWQLHGGEWHGPRVETWTIPEDNFCGFMDTILQPALAEAEARGRNEGLRDALDRKWLCFHNCDYEEEVVSVTYIKALINTSTEEPK